MIRRPEVAPNHFGPRPEHTGEPDIVCGRNRIGQFLLILRFNCAYIACLFRIVGRFFVQRPRYRGRCWSRGVLRCAADASALTLMMKSFTVCGRLRSNLARAIHKDETGQLEAIRCLRNIGRLSTV
jgi:hypothetical protein